VDLSHIERDEWTVRCFGCGHLFDRPRDTYPGVALQFCASRECQRDQEIRFGVGSKGATVAAGWVRRDRRK
jgi:hypothetical protein